MSTTEKAARLTRSMTQNEQVEILDRALAAFDRDDEETGNALLRQLPILPGLAKLMFESAGREYCEKRFNLSAANEEFGEGWMDA